MNYIISRSPFHRCITRRSQPTIRFMFYNMNCHSILLPIGTKCFTNNFHTTIRSAVIHDNYFHPFLHCLVQNRNNTTFHILFHIIDRY